MHHPIDYSELGLLVMFRRAALRLTRAGDHRLTGDDSSPPRRPSNSKHRESTMPWWTRTNWTASFLSPMTCHA